jgi:hypothetical protein
MAVQHSSSSNQEKMVCTYIHIYIHTYIHIHRSQMKQQSVVSRRYTVLQEIEETWQILNTPTRKHAMFLRKYEERIFFCGHNILTEGVCVTQRSSKAGISVSQFWGSDKLVFHERNTHTHTHTGVYITVDALWNMSLAYNSSHSTTNHSLPEI